MDSVEIITLQDNYIEVTAQDNTAIVSRATALKNGEISNSILAEHGFSALVRTTRDDSTETILCDFGFSPEGTASNTKALNAPMNDVEIMVLSHGHSDHTGGLEALRRMIGGKGIDFLCHPAACTPSRWLEPAPDFKLRFPPFSREKLTELDINVIESKDPLLLSGGRVLFLGEIEKIADLGKGLVVLSECAHAGIVNTAKYAMKITGSDKIHTLRGGLHLSGPLFEPIIERTTEELAALNPDHVIPCHCTGRKAVAYMEQAMPNQFIFNMSGTTRTFTA